MGQVFPRSANSIAVASIIGGGLLAGLLALAAWVLVWSPYMTQQNVPIPQPVPFSHQRHVEGNGLDCRYCHTSVENASFAGIPPTHTCMTCHSQVFTNAAILAPIRDSYANNTPIEWTRVYDLPDYVYFDHSIHIAKGVGCTTCHGPIGDMPLTWKAVSLKMSWCLNCHRHPENYLRPADQIFNADYQVPANQAELGAELVKQNNLNLKLMTSCSTCHR
jgi:Cytochrome c7 and related cytochrome c